MFSLSEEYEVTVSNAANRNDPGNYSEALKKVCSFKTAEELSYFLHHIKLFTETSPVNINLFKKGVSASWEDEANINGCSWIVQFKPEVSNILFERICYYFCLEGFKTFPCNGIKVNIRKGFVKFGFWSAAVPSVVDGTDVLAELQKSLGLEFSVDFSYKNHKELLDKVTVVNNAIC